MIFTVIQTGQTDDDVKTYQIKAVSTRSAKWQATANAGVSTCFLSIYDENQEFVAWRSAEDSTQGNGASGWRPWLTFQKGEPK